MLKWIISNPAALVGTLIYVASMVSVVRYTNGDTKALERRERRRTGNSTK